MTTYAFGPKGKAPLKDYFTGEPLKGFERPILMDGVAVGRLHGWMRGKELHVEWVEVRDGPGSLGTAAMKQLGAQLRQEGVTAVSGNRITGTHVSQHVSGSTGVPVKVSLIGKPNVIGGGRWITHNGKHIFIAEPA